MKNTGIVRRIDELGRFVLPKELRKQLEINDNDPLEVYVEGNNVILRKYAKSCSICGSEENVVAFNNHTLCTDCIDKIKKL